VNASVREVAADASFLINLIATRAGSELVGMVGCSLLVPRQVYDEVKRDRAQLDGMITGGHVRRFELEGDAVDHYVEATVTVDDGEAAAIALGLALRIEVATDDACAAGYFKRKSDGLNAFGICELLRSVETRIGTVRLKEMLECVRRDARFDPPVQEELWWSKVMNS
jgi:predicted nucleic acid-binding protein